MKPREFKQSNVILTGRGGIKKLPAFRDGEAIMSCWKMNLKDRLRALLWGRIWLRIRGTKTHPPVSLHCLRKGFK